MTARILMVDDEPNVLLAFKRQFRNEFSIQSALGPERALEILEKQGPFAVVVADMRMPGMNGIQFLARVRQVAPDSVRIMLTGAADVETATAAVNEGGAFRFLTKPCLAATLGQALEAGINQYRVVTAERELLEQTLSGAVQALTDVLAVTSPVAFGRASRLRPLVRDIAEQLDMPDADQLEVAATLSQLGCVMLPDETLRRVYAGARLNADELATYATHPRVARDLLLNLPRLRDVAYAIGNQDSPPHSALDVPPEVNREWVTLASRVLKVVLDYDILVASGRDANAACTEMEARTNTYDLEVLKVLRAVLGVAVGLKSELVPLNQLRPGMVLDEDVFSEDRLLILPRARELTPALLARLDELPSTGRSGRRVRIVLAPEVEQLPEEPPIEGEPATTQAAPAPATA